MTSSVYQKVFSTEHQWELLNDTLPLSEHDMYCVLKQVRHQQANKPTFFPAYICFIRVSCLMFSELMYHTH